MMSLENGLSGLAPAESEFCKRHIDFLHACTDAAAVVHRMTMSIVQALRAFASWQLCAISAATNLERQDTRPLADRVQR